MASNNWTSLSNINKLHIHADDVDDGQQSVSSSLGKLSSVAVADHKDQVKKETTFLDLPREMRDIIYEMVLVQDLPIEFAPITDRLYKDFWEPRGEDPEEFPYFFEHYREDIRPTLRFLRVSKQINEEATPIYYGQPSRFTNQAGWWILAHWLDAIGPRNRTYVKDITAYYAGQVLYRQFLWPLRLPWLPRFGSKCYFNEWHFPSGRDADPETMKSILAMPNLRELKLILRDPYQGKAKPSLNYDSLLEHPIYGDTTQSLTKANVSVINLVSIFTQAADHYELTLEDLLDGSPSHRLSARLRWNRADPQWTKLYDDAVQTISKLRALGISVTEQRRDRHDAYHIGVDEWCVNEGYCEYIRNIWAGWYTGPDGVNTWRCAGTEGSETER